MNNFRYIRGVATLMLNQDRCIGCGICVQVCPHRVFVCENRRAQIVDADGCMECGACSLNCPAGALEVNPGVG